MLYFIKDSTNNNIEFIAVDHSLTPFGYIVKNGEKYDAYFFNGKDRIRIFLQSAQKWMINQYRNM